MAKTVLITGGSRGIGRAAAHRFAEDGWQVAIGCRQVTPSVVEFARSIGAAAIGADLSQPDGGSRLAQEALAQLGHLDCLVCAAGIALPQMLVTDVSDPQWDELLAVNVTAPFRTIREVLPHMIRRKQGSIVTLSSIWGVAGGSCEVAYSTTKAAVIGLTKSLAREVGPSGITVNCVAPGVIDTDMNAHLSAEDKSALAEETPLGRIGTPDEIARCIRFLADAPFVTGQVLTADGGFL